MEISHLRCVGTMQMGDALGVGRQDGPSWAPRTGFPCRRREFTRQEERRRGQRDVIWAEGTAWAAARS